MKKLTLLVFLMGLMVLSITGVSAEDKKNFKIAWSHYTGWEPWAYADHAGILKRNADKEGIAIKLDLINDYVESINLYTSGAYDGCVMTNMDALTIPAVGGVDSEVIIVGDYSNGNDGIVTREIDSVKDLKGQKVKLVELSVSHYLLARALEINEMKEKELELINTSDADIGALFVSDTSKGATVTWNPILMQLRNVPGAKLIFDSSKIPNEILDLMVVKTDAPASLKRALVRTWYETLEEMKNNDKAIAFMAKNSGATPAEFKAQMKTTHFYPTREEAKTFINSSKLPEVMNYVRQFSFAKGLFGSAIKSVDGVGIKIQDTVLGSKDNVKLRFTDKYLTQD